MPWTYIPDASPTGFYGGAMPQAQQPSVSIPVNSQSEFERALKFANKWQAKQDRKKKEEEAGKKKDEPKKPDNKVMTYLHAVAVCFAVTPLIFLLNAGIIIMVIKMFSRI